MDDETTKAVQEAVAAERKRCEGWVQWFRHSSETDLRSVAAAIRGGEPVPTDGDEC